MLFDKEGRIRHYNSPEEIIQEFYEVRLEYYENRREALIKVCAAGRLEGGKGTVWMHGADGRGK